MVYALLGRTVFLIGLLVALGSSDAEAQATRTWVSGVGDDVNPCSRTAPCKTFAGAIGKTAPNGEINCLDPAGFGAVTITKSITIDCTGTLGGLLVGGGSAVVINASSTAVVRLRGLDINGIGASASVHGVNITTNGAAAVYVENCVIYGFPQQGIRNAVGGTRLIVRNSIIRNNAGGNILLQPTNGQTQVTTISDSMLSDGQYGVRVDGTLQTAGQVKAEVINTVASDHGANGYLATADTGQAAARLKVTKSVARNNASFGVVGTGTQAFVFVEGSSLTENGTGLAQQSGAIVASNGNNGINFNTTNTSGTITLVPLQ